MSAATEPQGQDQKPKSSRAALARAKAKVTGLVPPRHRPTAKVKWGGYAATLTLFLCELARGWGVELPPGAEATLTPLVGFGIAWYVRDHPDDLIFFDPDWDDLT